MPKTKLGPKGTRLMALEISALHDVLERARKVLNAADHRKLKAVVDALESVTDLLGEQNTPGKPGVAKGRVKRK